ncbi:hypothetical protein BDZ88DRAFT_47089 [Geranomyces variabilis]|nr:hypothetical protein BDZ88DRAFT_47089 [Geranomyces variabilis]KAJ3135173.1 hypothetical protein HDU90_004205 [Geranomyces variabilis]
MKRRYSDINSNTDTLSWLAGRGVDAGLEGFKAKTPRRPRGICQGYSFDTGARCTTKTPARSGSHPDFLLCDRHNMETMRAVLRRLASVRAHAFGRFIASRDDDDETKLRMNVAGITRYAPSARLIKGGFLYCFQRMDVPHAGPKVPVVKIGADFAEEDDDTEDRLEQHEKKPCFAEINHNVVSGYIKELADFEALVLASLKEYKVDIDCLCGQNHREYFEDKDEVWQVVALACDWIMREQA